MIPPFRQIELLTILTLGPRNGSTESMSPESGADRRTPYNGPKISSSSLKGRHSIAQGNALGNRALCSFEPCRGDMRSPRKKAYLAHTGLYG
jgi:hypothetical protein